MNEFLIYLLGVIVSFIMSVITFRFGNPKFDKKDYYFMMPSIIFVWAMSWIGAVVMLFGFIVFKIADSTITGKLYNKLVNCFIKLVTKK